MILALVTAALLSATPDVWYLPTEDNKARLFVEEIGSASAPPVVVLHGGWGAEHSYLEPVLKLHAGTAHRFVLYDQRGSLLSPVADAHELTVQQQIDDLDLLRRTLGIEKITLFAHSMGTYLAMAYSHSHPDHVRALILTGTLPARTPEGGAAAFWNAANAYGQSLMERPAVAQQLHALEESHDPNASRLVTHR